MKKPITLCVLILIVLNSFSATTQFILRGKVEGVTSGNVELTYWTIKTHRTFQKKIKAVINQNCFLLKGSLVEPVRSTLTINNKDIELYIEPKEMELYIQDYQNNKFILKGSKTQKDADQFSKVLENLENVAMRIHNEDVRNYEQLKNMPETDSNYKKLIEERKIISFQRDSIRRLKTKKEINLIKANLGSYYPFLSHSIEIIVSQGYLSVDSARILFNGFDKKVRLSDTGIQTNTYLKIKEGISIGKIAPDFITPDTIGKMIKLSDFRGKSYVLLDFWASWCVPCIKGIPHLKNLYAKYHDKGFKIIGISTDRSKKDWLTSIKQHNISLWQQVASVRDIEKNSQGYIDTEDISEKYPTDGIPKYILIDKTGKIIGKWEGYSKKNEKDMDSLLKEIFGE